MTLIPLISAMMAAPDTVARHAGSPTLQPRYSYGAGRRHRPVAALVAVGLPALLVAFAALSPMIVVPPPKSEPITGTLIELPKPPPPEPAKDAKPAPKTASVAETVPPRVETLALNNDRVVVGPAIPDARPVDPGPAVFPADPPAPKLVLAELDARFAGAFQPDYPAREQRRGVEGVVKVRVLIGTDGRVKAVELVSSDSPGFFEETRRRALAKWRFRPATCGGVPEESWKVMTVRFEIRNG